MLGIHSTLCILLLSAKDIYINSQDNSRFYNYFGLQCKNLFNYTLPYSSKILCATECVISEDVCIAVKTDGNQCSHCHACPVQGNIYPALNNSLYFRDFALFQYEFAKGKLYSALIRYLPLDGFISIGFQKLQKFW